jgi:transcriptional regulator with PAS, ATPase and Fis domain
MPRTPQRSSDEAGDRPRRPRGERWWHAAAEPIFLLSGQRRLLYANPAWEQAVGVTFAEARGRACRRRSAASAVEHLEQVLSALAPPPEAMLSRPCQTRRRAPGKAQAWWEIDYFPWSNAESVQGILGKLRVIHEVGPAHAALPEKLVQLRARTHRVYGLESWASDEPTMQRLVAQLRLAAQTRLPALILGPAGAGKTWAARTIHQLSAERESFFAAFDARLPAAALAELLASSRSLRLRTLFVRNVERLPRDAQALLVQRLETESSEAEPRVLAGSAADLAAEIRGGRFLPELHCRLSALTLHVPALADRLADLPRLLDSVLPRAGETADRAIHGVSAAALEQLRRHSWPGNLREFYDVLVQACQRASGGQLGPDDLPFYLRNTPAAPEQPMPLDETLAKVERRLIELAMRLAQDNKTRAAELLAIWRPRLVRRLDQFAADVQKMNHEENKEDPSPNQ